VDSSNGRLLTLLELLQAYRQLSANEIASRLDISTRTVRRYVKGLQEMGIPVEADRGPAGAYRMRPGFKLPPLVFTNDEGLAIVLGLLATQRLGLLTAGPAVQGALAKLDRVMPASLRERLLAAKEMVRLDLAPAAGNHADGETILRLSSAARDRTRLRIHYRSARGEETERTVDPYGIAFQGGEWYLTGWDHLRQDLRTFRLDRLIDFEIIHESFVRPDDFDLLGYMRQNLADLPYTWRAEVTLHAPMEEVRKRVGPAVGTLESVEGGVLLRIGSDDLDWIVRFLAGLGLDFTVLAPVELRQAARQEAERLVGCARRRTSPRRTQPA
jgi:predicted DNA-binding transcriptional regulator YafY